MYPYTISSQHLIIFSRYPEPGKTKTRLIPALGAEGAANLQRQMTEHTIQQVQKLQNTTSISVEIRFSGGNFPLMQAWLGNDLIYQSQGEGDLGNRMANAFNFAFCDGAKRVITIGIDCPDVNAEVLTAAYQELINHDLVLGPAVDGGYYLIGLCRLIPQLFIDMKWGSDEVLAQTVKVAEKLNLSVGYLPKLADIDRPEDLKLFKSKFST